MTHLHWLFTKGPKSMRDVSLAITLCGKRVWRHNKDHDKVTTFLEETTCKSCRQIAIAIKENA